MIVKNKSIPRSEFFSYYNTVCLFISKSSYKYPNTKNLEKYMIPVYCLCCLFGTSRKVCDDI